MKQNYLFLIIILSTYHTMFSMENPAEAITKSYKLAERLDREGKLQPALDKYKEVINIKLPDPDPILGDPYKNERDSQSKATIKIADLEITLMIQPLIYANKYDEAFAQLNTLSPEKQTTNKQTIQKLKKKITDNKLKWEENQLKEAEELADAGNYTLAYQTLDTLNTQKISQEINNQAIQLKASIKEKQEAARKQQLANAQQAANHEDYAEAYRILDALMDEGYLAANDLKKKIQDQQAARQREEAEQQRLAAEEAQREQEEQQRQAQEEAERQRLAAEQARQEQERLAEQTRQGEEQARQEQLANAQQAANSGDYAEAYRILDALRSAGYLPANDLKNRIIDQQAARQREEAEQQRLTAEEAQREQERQRQQEEQQRQAQEEAERQRLAAEQAHQEQERLAEQTRQREQEQERQRREEQARQEQERRKREEEARQEAERLARERAAQPPTAQQIAQEQNLKNALAHLTNTLKSITKYLPRITRPSIPTGQTIPSTEPILLPPLARKPSRPGGRRPLPPEARPAPAKADQSTPLKGSAAVISKALEDAYAAIINQRTAKIYSNVVYYLKQNNLYPKNLTRDEETELAIRIRELVKKD